MFDERIRDENLSVRLRGVEGVYHCPEDGCEFFVDGRGRPYYLNNRICDQHALGEHSKRWRPQKPPMGKLLGLASSPGHTPVVVDEFGEWWAWSGGMWNWAPDGWVLT